MIPAILLVTFTPVCLKAASFVGFREQAFQVTNPGPLGLHGLVAVDVDGDGRDDLIASGDSVAALVLVYGVRGSDPAIVAKQVLTYPQNGVLQVGAVEDAVGPKVFILRTDGFVDLLGGWPLAVLDTVPVAPDANKALIKDVDADGEPELVVASYTATYLYDLAGHVEERNIPGYAVDVNAVQLDADPAFELVRLGFDSVQSFDALTGAAQGSVADVYGLDLVSGRFGPGAAWQVAVRKHDAAEWFSGSAIASQGSWVSDLNSTRSADAVDVDGDMRDELLVADEHGGIVRVLDSSTHLERFNISYEDPHVFMSAIKTMDIDGDGQLEVALTRQYPDFETCALPILVRLNDTETVGRFFTEETGILVTRFGDVDGDGRAELLLGGGADSQSGHLYVLDPATGTIKWRTDYDSWDGWAPFNMVYRRIWVGNLDGEPRPEIVVAGENIYDGRIMIIDGPDKLVERDIYQYASGVLADRGVGGLVIEDVTGDGVAEIVVGTHALTTGSSNARVQAFSVATGAEVWAGPGIGSDPWSRVRDMFTGQLDADAAYELVVITSDRVACFDAITHALDCNFPATARGGF
ncbi:MAG: hypothetical protein KDK91_24510, partial [Gammaproteobacteria bacterium]|nr:hypothetical protein [Gammaproteobacteria bacterium]